MPYVMRWNRPSIETELTEIAQAIGLSTDELISRLPACLAGSAFHRRP